MTDFEKNEKNEKNERNEEEIEFESEKKNKKRNKILVIVSLIVALSFLATIGVIYAKRHKTPPAPPQITTEATEKPIDDFTLSVVTREDQSGTDKNDNGLYSIKQNENYEILTGYNLD